MPEGNEIHRWAERHAAAFTGKVVRVDGPQGRFLDSDLIDGRKLVGVRAVGKHLGYDFGKDRILHIHLGLRGDFSEGSGPLPEVKGALRLRMWNAAAVKLPVAPGESKRHAWYSEDDGTGHTEAPLLAWVELRGPTDCTIWTEAKWATLLDRLGPDPLNGDGPEKAIERIRKSKKAIGALLMDQSVIAGIGNIYRAELLFRARVSPFAAGKDVPETTLRAMWKDLRPLMQAGMKDRRIVTTLPKDRPSRSKGSALKDEAHYVYRRHGRECFICSTKILKQDMEARNLYWCPTCQRDGQVG
jgi:endonuclease-8